MTVVAIPLDAVAGAPQYAAQDERTAKSAIYGAMPGRPLGARSGLRPGTPQVLSSTGTSWIVGRCSGVLDPNVQQFAGPYNWAVTSNESGDINPSQTNPRWDAVYLRIQDNAIDLSGQATAVVEYVAGTPASSPSRPTVMADGVTPLSQGFVFGWIYQPATGGGLPAVTQNKTFTTAAGGILRCETSADYPANNANLTGTVLYDVALDELLVHDGSSFKVRSTKPEVKAGFTAVTTNSLGNATVNYGATFTGTPVPSVTPASLGGGFSMVTIGSLFSTGFTFTARNNAGNVMGSSNVAVTWIVAGSLA